MRIVKDSAERRTQILDVSEELFASKGYVSTSTNDIIEQVGIARGTLYYHFKSKEEILDAVVLRFTNNLIKKAREVSKDTSIPLLDRISLTMKSLSSDTPLGRELLYEIHKSENALLHQKVQDIMISNIALIFEQMIKEGNEQGLFNCSYPFAVADMIITYSYIAFDSTREISLEDKKLLIKGFIVNIERLLGVAEGSLVNSILKIFE